MKNKILLVIFGLGLSLFSFKSVAQETDFDLSKIDRYREAKEKALPVQDFDSVFTPKERQNLSKMFLKYHKKSTNVFVVVTVGSIAPFGDAQQMATALGSYWGVGHQGKNNGLVMLLCKPCKSFGIATGDGTRKVITDSMSLQTMEQVIFPQFKKDKFYDGIKNGAESLMKIWGDGD
ncbi:TPM domain-containing protein [Gaetbulibacter aestuarii]|uniref:TPM domain-containing protein n=1 Tax=Gaetbulibacter aestuarii TaxID=1502358 RepID=A0ABW7MV23_9FLAO